MRAGADEIGPTKCQPNGRMNSTTKFRKWFDEIAGQGEMSKSVGKLREQKSSKDFVKFRRRFRRTFRRTFVEWPWKFRRMTSGISSNDL